MRHLFDYEFDAFGFPPVRFGLLSGGSSLAEQPAGDSGGNARTVGDHWDDALPDAACALYRGALGDNDSSGIGSGDRLLPLPI